MFEEAISLLSMCSSVNTWLTPTVLFLLLNLMIGTILFTSQKPSPHHHPTTNNHLTNHHEFPQQFQQHHHLQQFQHQHQHQQTQPQLISRSSSVLQRLKSINFNSLYNLYTPPPPTTTPTTHHHHQQPEPETRPEPEPTPTTAAEVPDEGEGEGPTLDEIYSRIKQGNQVAHYGRQNSDTKPSGGEIPVKLSKKMKKSASVKSAFNHFQFQPPNPGNNGVDNVGVAATEAEERESGGVAAIREEREDEGGVESASVDAQADDFINRFKRQLQLQRNDSILRYKNMISKISAK